jgi:hypothetical protein
LIDAPHVDVVPRQIDGENWPGMNIDSNALRSPWSRNRASGVLMGRFGRLSRTTRWTPI